MTSHARALPLLLALAVMPVAALAAPDTTSAGVTLDAQIVPTIGGLFPIAPADLAGEPVATSLVVRVTNHGDAPVVLRTGGDDEGFTLSIEGPGVTSVRRKARCRGPWRLGTKHAIPARGHVDLPLEVFASGPRCRSTSHYLTRAGDYQLVVALTAHVHASSGRSARGDRGTEIHLATPTSTLRTGAPRGGLADQLEP